MNEGDIPNHNWPQICKILNRHQQMRFGWREPNYPYQQLSWREIGQPEVAGELIAKIIEAVADGKRLISLIGGPGSGKSYTAWELYQQLVDAGNYQPLYLPLAFECFIANDAADLYDLAIHIARQHSGEEPNGNFTSDKSFVFIVDDMFFSNPDREDPREIVTPIIRTHLQNHAADRVILLHDENGIKDKDENYVIEDYGVAGSNVGIVLQGFTNLDNRWIYWADKTKASFIATPLLLDAITTFRISQDLQSYHLLAPFVAMRKAIWATDTKKHSDELVKVVECLTDRPKSLIEIGPNIMGHRLAHPSGNAARHMPLFTIQAPADEPKTFRFATIYSYISSAVLHMTGAFFLVHETEPKQLLALPPTLKQLRSKLPTNCFIADLQLAAYFLLLGEMRDNIDEALANTIARKVSDWDKAWKEGPEIMPACFTLSRKLLSSLVEVYKEVGSQTGNSSSVTHNYGGVKGPVNSGPGTQNNTNNPPNPPPPSETVT